MFSIPLITENLYSVVFWYKLFHDVCYNILVLRSPLNVLSKYLNPIVESTLWRNMSYDAKGKGRTICTFINVMLLNEKYVCVSLCSPIMLRFLSYCSIRLSYLTLCLSIEIDETSNEIWDFVWRRLNESIHLAFSIFKAKGINLILLNKFMRVRQTMLFIVQCFGARKKTSDITSYKLMFTNCVK